MKVIKKVIEINHHRNGVSGADFYIVKFASPKERDKRKFTNMIAIVFDEPGHVAVFDYDLLKLGNTKFCQNSWRGDVFEKELRELIKED